jgi:acetylornithine/succinyldiaminopimelate/putrescine aminotransferase
MMLTRFFSLDGQTEPEYAGRIPVFLVMADHAGGPTGNYHGTTVLAQTLRGLWPQLYRQAEEAALYRVVPVPINDPEAFEAILTRYNQAPYKTAGFCHEIILMNYGGIRLEESYLRKAYALCRKTGTPVLCDEIQSCAWYGGLFLFRRYGLEPDFVSVGKGFPGGEYPASKILASGAFDSMSQFGALVTNGQEELASLSYLITMAFIRENGEAMEQTGRFYHECLRSLAARYPDLCDGVTGDGHMSALSFRRIEQAAAFCRHLNNHLCVDASAQTYKINCPPVVLTKLPLITSESMAERLTALMEQALQQTLRGEASV